MELWIHGMPGSPGIAKEMGAKGLRQIVDLRGGVNVKAIESLLRKYNELDMGVCMTVRWRDPWDKGVRRNGKEDADKAPTKEESDHSIEQIMYLVTRPDAKALEGRIWIQLFSEIIGGPGTYPPEDEDAMFEYATKLTKRIRKEAPHVKVSGPSLTAVDILTQNERSLSKQNRIRRARLLRTIQWSAEHADAIDLHLHAEDGEWTRKMLSITRRFLNEYEGGVDTDILTWEWSCARFKNRTDQDAVRNALQEIYDAMKEFDVPIAAYASYWPGEHQTERHQWKSLANDDGTPKEPFYSFFVEHAKEQ